MRRYLILSASMGDGHQRVAEQLRYRLVSRGDAAQVVDIMQVLPFRLGPALREAYSAMLRHAPWVYDAIYREFFVPREGQQHGDVLRRPDLLVAASSPALRRLIERYRPDAVVSTFHLCAQIAGRLRARGELPAPSIVVVTDFVAHRMWLHPGNDRFVCVHPAVASEAAASTGRPAFAAAPAIDPAFTSMDGVAPARSTLRASLGLPALPAVLVSAGAWGAGEIVATVRAITSSGYLTLVLSGRNEKLRHQLEIRDDLKNMRVLGWRDDVADVMRASDVLIDNAAGQTAMEALAVGLPIVSFSPLPGHGRDGVLRMQALGLSTHAPSGESLKRAVSELTAAGSSKRRHQIDAGRALFTADPVEFLGPGEIPAPLAAPRS